MVDERTLAARGAPLTDAAPAPEQTVVMPEDGGVSQAAGEAGTSEAQAAMENSVEASHTGLVLGSQRVPPTVHPPKGTSGKESAATAHPSSEQPTLNEVQAAGIVNGHHDEQVSMSVERSGITHIEIGLKCSGIEDLDYSNVRSSQGDPVSAISVGHYMGVTKLQAAELALDRAISRALYKMSTDNADLTKHDLILTQYAQRGIISGELGRPFFLTDPRQQEHQDPAEHEGKVDRVIAIAGMGVPGSFGAPELTVLARELCWSLGQLGKPHLATVLIGAGEGNLSVREAVAAWMRGVKYAVTGLSEAARQHVVKCITFVERDGRKIREIQETIRDMKCEWEKRERLKVDYEGFSEDELKQLETNEREQQLYQLARELVHELEAEQLETNEREQQLYQLARELVRTLAVEQKAEDSVWEPPAGQLGKDGGNEPVPIHVTVSLDRDRQTYRFGAITGSATIPEREIRLDPILVEEANHALASETYVQRQYARGRFMEEFLVPDDLRAKFYKDAPLVMLLDKAAAGIHWEMIAQSDPTLSSGRLRDENFSTFNEDDHDSQTFEEFERFFLGTSRGFTRQLRSTFAPPPEAPPPPQRKLRALVVANPANDLPEAAEEGQELYELFTNFNNMDPENSIEVVRLSGPYQASRLNVLRYLMLHSFDILHFAGHCFYNPDDPASSGWIFANNKILTAKELNRIDRIPKFVFSNACESGITAEEANKHSAELAHTFAEEFFVRGVSNFVCTAWPVEEYAARLFALTLYSHLLGIRKIGDQENKYVLTEQLPMYTAMREARLRIAREEKGGRTWGAYQHYGNPYLRFFDPRAIRRTGTVRKNDLVAVADR